ncbi:hypothetical protein [Collimonas humicola]|uniref:hypothetical protein n=1 Tax=Collimonas humicola TaxID=2825886 RepID=UPI001B8BC04C|nr:hypothetical protein [Collimonas humicola]
MSLHRVAHRPRGWKSALAFLPIAAVMLLAVFRQENHVLKTRSRSKTRRDFHNWTFDESQSLINACIPGMQIQPVKNDRLHQVVFSGRRACRSAVVSNANKAAGSLLLARQI